MNIEINNVAKADIFVTLFQNLKTFTPTVNVMFTTDKMFIQTMDSAHVSIVELSLPSTWFDVYNIASDVTIGISTILIGKVLSTRDKTQHIHLKFYGSDNDKLYVDFVGSATNIFDRHFEIPLMEMDADIMHIPEIDYQSEFSIPSGTFTTIVNQLQLFGDTMQIDCSEEKIVITALGIDTGKMTVDIPIDDLTSFAIQEGIEIHPSFSLKHIQSISSYSKLAKDIEINMSNDYPLKLQYSLGEENATFAFYLAPKMNDDWLHRTWKHIDKKCNKDNYLV